MEINTDFNIGDDIHFLFENRHIQSIVRRINITVTSEGISGHYSCSKEDGQVTIKCGIEKAFKTKKELLNSL